MLDRIAPPRMGRSFRWLLGSTYVSNVGDGIALAAGPLLVASQTDNAILVAMAALLQRLPGCSSLCMPGRSPTVSIDAAWS